MITLLSRWSFRHASDSQTIEHDPLGGIGRGPSAEHTPACHIQEALPRQNPRQARHRFQLKHQFLILREYHGFHGRARHHRQLLN